MLIPEHVSYQIRIFGGNNRMFTFKTWFFNYWPEFHEKYLMLLAWDKDKNTNSFWNGLEHNFDIQYHVRHVKWHVQPDD